MHLNMKLMPCIVVVLLAVTLSTGCKGVGSANDRDVGANPEGTPAAPPTRGVVYVLSPNSITIVDPETRATHKVTQGISKVGWGDAARTPDGRLLFMNDQDGSEVVVFDTDKRQIVKRIPVGTRPTHIWNPHGGNEIWTHADREGKIYVIDATKLAVTAVIEKPSKEPGHGKLLWARDLGNKAYVTDTGTNRLYKVDLEAKKITGFVETCQGTHGISYSEISKHVYVACGGSKTVTVVDPATDTVVANLEGGGQVWPGAYDGQLSHKEPMMLSPVGDKINMIDPAHDKVVGELAVGNVGTVKIKHMGGRTLAVAADNAEPLIYVMDVGSKTLVRRLGMGAHDPSAKAEAHEVNSTAGGHWFFNVRSADGFLSIVDVETQMPHALMFIEKGARRVFWLE